MTQQHGSSGIPLNDVSSPAPSSPPVSSSSLSSTSPVISNLGSNSSSNPDFQAQMMLMLNGTFSKLSFVIIDIKSIDTKADWPKFSRDLKKFKAWYLAILAQLSLSPWQDLHDSGSNDIVQPTFNTALNGKLYANLLVA